MPQSRCRRFTTSSALVRDLRISISASTGLAELSIARSPRIPPFPDFSSLTYRVALASKIGCMVNV